MRRKPNTLVPLETSILAAATHLKDLGILEFHGFQVAKEMGDLKHSRLLTGYGTLYRALQRLEQFGYLVSHWEDPAIGAEQNRPRRRLYQLTDKELK
jgi:DNA-binding PadR family transcriptional regulator